MEYKAHISKVFDRSASEYGGFGTHYFEMFAEELVNRAPASFKARVLDVATGRGAILKRLLPQVGPEGEVVGVDLSREMIEETRRRIRTKNVSLQCMDAEALDFEDSTFDAVYCGFGLFFFPHVRKALSEFKRVLKPSGKIAISTWGEIGKTRRILKEQFASFEIDPTVTAHPMPTEQELKELFVEAGFSSIHLSTSTLAHRYFNFEHWFECLWRHATRSSLEKLSPEQLEILQQNLCEALDTENRSDGFHETMNVIYTIAH